MTKKTTTKVLDLATLNPKHLKELQGWEEKQVAILNENQFVQIVDTKTYEEGKKARTNLRTARTDLEKQEREVASALAQFRKQVGNATSELIEITLDAEKRQQSEVKRYEEERQRIAEEKRLAEAKRLDDLREEVLSIGKLTDQLIYRMNIDNIAQCESDFKEFLERFDPERYLDIGDFLMTTISSNEKRLGVRTEKIVEDEKIRLEKERIAKEREEQHQERMALRKIAEEQEKQAEELARQKKTAAQTTLQSNLMIHALTRGYTIVGGDDKKIVEKDGDMISFEFVTSPSGEKLLPFNSIEELLDHIAQVEEEKKVKAERIRKEEEAKKKIKTAEIEIKAEVVKKKSKRVQALDQADISHFEGRIETVESLIKSDINFSSDYSEVFAEMHTDLKHDILDVCSKYKNALKNYVHEFVQ